jgi:hypothetical protein
MRAGTLMSCRSVDRIRLRIGASRLRGTEVRRRRRAMRQKIRQKEKQAQRWSGEVEPTQRQQEEMTAYVRASIS